MRRLPEYVIKGGRVIDATGERTADVLVRDGKVADVAPDLTTSGDVLEAQRCVVSPGFVDLHVHLREPGDEEAETIETGTRAARAGGFTAVVAMPNTRPALDDAAVVSSVLALGKQAGLCDVVSSGCITVARAGEQLAPMGELYALGVRIFTDDGFCVASAGVMRRALRVRRIAARRHRRPARRGRDPRRRRAHARGRVVEPPRHPGPPLGRRDRDRGARHRALRGDRHAGPLPPLLGGRHRRPGADGQGPGTSRHRRVRPHHFSLTDECCEGFDPMFKVHPPLRTQADVDAIREGLADGTIDAIATDHAPHTPESKERPFEEAPPGMLGLETALAVTITELVEPGHLSLRDALACLSWRPAALAGLDAHGGPIVPGAPANLTIFDPAHEWMVEPDALASRARNTPFAGRTLKGKVRHTVLFGNVVVRDGEATR